MQNKSFFSRFLKQLKQNYGGRYISYILKEVLEDDPSILKSLFNFGKDFDCRHNLSYVINWSFPGKEQGRLADLAIIKDRKPIALLEIKYEDEKQPKNQAQLEDYMLYCNENKIPFTYLTQYGPPEKHTNQLKHDNNCKKLLYRELYLKIEGKPKQPPVTKLFCKFMKENYMVYRTDINPGALNLFVLKGLSVKFDSGMGRTVGENNINALPELLEILIGNVTSLGERFYAEHEASFNVKPNIRFGFDCKWDTKKIQSDLEKAERKKAPVEWLDSSRKTGGYFDIGFSLLFKKEKRNDEWLYISWGYHFDLDLEKKKLTLETYSALYGKGWKDEDGNDGYIYHPKTINCRKGDIKPPEFDVCYKDMMGLTKKCCKEFIKKDKWEVPRGCHKSFAAFLKKLSK